MSEARVWPLNRAAEIITGERRIAYGEAEDSFGLVALYWNVYLTERARMDEEEIRPQDVAMMMVLFKIAREQSGESKADNYVDAAGYLGLAYELATTVDGDVLPQ